jgi:hypothetical protein
MCAPQPAASAALGACYDINTAGHVKKGTESTPRGQASHRAEGPVTCPIQSPAPPNQLPQPAPCTPHPLAALCQRPQQRVSLTENPTLGVLPSLCLRFLRLLSQKGLCGPHSAPTEAISVSAAPDSPRVLSRLASAPYRRDPGCASAQLSSPKRSHQLPNCVGTRGATRPKRNQNPMGPKDGGHEGVYSLDPPL